MRWKPKCVREAMANATLPATDHDGMETRSLNAQENCAHCAHCASQPSRPPARPVLRQRLRHPRSLQPWPLTQLAASQQPEPSTRSLAHESDRRPEQPSRRPPARPWPPLAACEPDRAPCARGPQGFGSTMRTAQAGHARSSAQPNCLELARGTRRAAGAPPLAQLRPRLHLSPRPWPSARLASQRPEPSTPLLAARRRRPAPSLRRSPGPTSRSLQSQQPLAPLRLSPTSTSPNSLPSHTPPRAPRWQHWSWSDPQSPQPWSLHTLCANGLSLRLHCTRPRADVLSSLLVAGRTSPRSLKHIPSSRTRVQAAFALPAQRICTVSRQEIGASPSSANARHRIEFQRRVGIVSNPLAPAWQSACAQFFPPAAPSPRRPGSGALNCSRACGSGAWRVAAMSNEGRRKLFESSKFATMKSLISRHAARTSEAHTRGSSWNTLMRTSKNHLRRGTPRSARGRGMF